MSEEATVADVLERAERKVAARSVLVLGRRTVLPLLDATVDELRRARCRSERRQSWLARKVQRERMSGCSGRRALAEALAELRQERMCRELLARMGDDDGEG